MPSPFQTAKSLFSLTTESTHLSVRCTYYSNTDHYHIGTTFQKSGNGTLSTNHECSSFLGCHVAEQILSKIFDNVELMPYGNPGYDFRCGNGFLVDVKSAVMTLQNVNNKNYDKWIFGIAKNSIPDYYLLIAFDNRVNLTPLHLWLIPGNNINYLTCISISPSTIKKWNEYELSDKLDDLKSYCNSIG